MYISGSASPPEKKRRPRGRPLGSKNRRGRKRSDIGRKSRATRRSQKYNRERRRKKKILLSRVDQDGEYDQANSSHHHQELEMNV